jgi:multicomponent Na+:H+ antiporter subunit D
MADLLLHPVLPFAVGALLVWFAPSRVGRAVMIAAPVVALLQLAQLSTGTSVEASYVGFELTVLRVDGLAMPFGWVFAVAALIAGTYGLTTMGPRERAAALAYVGAAMGVVFAGDLMTFFVFWELKAVASSFVILARRGGSSGPAGTRYFFVHLVGGKLLLAGVLWHYAATGSLAFDSLELTGATSLILAAFLLSAAVPPLHAWLADAYPEASVAGTVFLSAFTTKAAVYALARGFPGTELLIYLGVVMAAYGVTYAMMQNDTRRLLAYHIVSQVGFMVTAVGIGTDMAINGAVAHAVAHIIYKGLLLMGVGAALHATGRSKISAMGGLANRMRTVLVLYLVGAVSISSVPLFSGFVSKELVVDAASNADLALVVLVLKVVSVGTFLSTGLKLPYTTWFGPQGAGPRHNTPVDPIEVRPVPVTMYLAMGAAALINLGIGLVPAPLYDLLPYPVDYVPYTLGKVVEKTQILLFTTLGFWLLLDRVTAKPKIVLDVDWLYRALPARIRAARVERRPGAAVPLEPTPVGRAAAAHRPASPAAGGTAPAAATATATLERDEDVQADTGVTGTGLRTRLTSLFAVREGIPPVPATWMLGAVLLVAAIVVLTASLLP